MSPDRVTTDWRGCESPAAPSFQKAVDDIVLALGLDAPSVVPELCSLKREAQALLARGLHSHCRALLSRPLQRKDTQALLAVGEALTQMDGVQPSGHLLLADTLMMLGTASPTLRLSVSCSEQIDALDHSPMTSGLLSLTFALCPEARLLPCSAPGAVPVTASPTGGGNWPLAVTTTKAQRQGGEPVGLCTAQPLTHSCLTQRAPPGCHPVSTPLPPNPTGSYEAADARLQEALHLARPSEAIRARQGLLRLKKGDVQAAAQDLQGLAEPDAGDLGFLLRLLETPERQSLAQVPSRRVRTGPPSSPAA